MVQRQVPHREGLEFGVPCPVTAVVITRFSGQPAALTYKERLERHRIPVFLHRSIDGYPNEIEHIASPDGFGANPYVPVTQPLVVVTAPGL